MRARQPTPVLPTACLLVLALAGCASTPPEQDPVQIKLNDLDTRLARIERVVANQSLFQLSNQVESLRSDLRSMHNDIDQLTNSLQETRKQQRDLYADLDRRMRSLEARAGSGAPAPPTGGSGDAGQSAAGADTAPSDDQAYQAAFALLKDGQYDRATAAFQKFLVTYPDSQFADNAQYWLGEANYVNKAFNEAQAAFQRVVDKYPQSRKVPDALLKIGYCEYELKQWGAARETLTKVTTQFTDTAAGHLAQQRLDRMTTEQH
jgi:tol-pal system protein YbgF